MSHAEKFPVSTATKRLAPKAAPHVQVMNVFMLCPSPRIGSAFVTLSADHQMVSLRRFL
jgi:hypothetical protein